MKSPFILKNDVLTSIVAAYLQSISAIPNEADVSRIVVTGFDDDKVSFDIHFKKEEVEIIYFD